MGLNAFFAYTICVGLGYSWQFALTAVFIEGIIFILLTVTNLRGKCGNEMIRYLLFAFGQRFGGLYAELLYLVHARQDVALAGRELLARLVVRLRCLFECLANTL